MAGRKLEALVLTEVEKSELTALAARPETAQALAGRARIVLACADGLENKVCSFRHERRRDVPCFSTSHSPAPPSFRPVLSTSK